MKKHVHPQYSVLDAFSMKVENDHGISLGINELVPFAKAGSPKSTLQNDIEVDEAIFMASLHEGGKYRFGNGTVTAPAIAFKGSPKTGVYRISANTMGLTVNGTLVATIDSTGIHPIAATAIGPISTDRILGRDTAGSGSVEQLTVTGGLEFTGSTGIQSSAYTGDVTKAAGGTSTTIANDAVTNAKAADMAQSTIKGRASGAGTGDPTDLTSAQATAILDLATTSVKGLAPVLSNVATEFLNGTGAYSTPATGSSWTTVMKTTTETITGDTTLTADSDLKFAMQANTRYAFKLVAFTDAAAVSDFKFRHSGPAAPTSMSITRYTIQPDNTTHTNIAVDSVYSAGDINMVDSGGGTAGYIELNGTIDNGPNAGDFEFHWAQRLANGSSASVLAGSHLMWMEVA